MNYLELKYMNLVAYKLRNYKQRSNRLINFSCPYCGDSSHKKNRARGYILEKNGSSVFYCHNCSVTKSVEQFIKFLDETTYQEMMMEKFEDTRKEKKDEYQVDFSTVKRTFSNKILGGMKKISQLKHDHPVKKYIESRMIPTNLHYKLYYCPKFMAWVNSIIPDKFSKEALAYDEPRLLIPFWDKEGNIHAFQGRSFKRKTDTKYITIVLDESTPKLYGLDTLDERARIYVLEGPIDSMFIPNAIATAGGDMVSAVSGFDKENLVIVYDNEPRSIETHHKLDKAIDNGYNVCIFPDAVTEKDINKMREAGRSSPGIKSIIDYNIYSGLEAKLRLAEWSKR